ncbi:uncharacterized protein G2W53_031544 [Senna tora]|uniref:Uncharacterized protein n=1 Tax=Senna tora TaxID=362788 RepID=A0A834T9E3_9FABA|nr:uncharacterized protein G2W53_031544 [Senna tora]
MSTLVPELLLCSSSSGLKLLYSAICEAKIWKRDKLAFSEAENIVVKDIGLLGALTYNREEEEQDTKQFWAALAEASTEALARGDERVDIQVVEAESKCETPRKRERADEEILKDEQREKAEESATALEEGEFVAHLEETLLKEEEFGCQEMGLLESSKITKEEKEEILMMDSSESSKEERVVSTPTPLCHNSVAQEKDQSAGECQEMGSSSQAQDDNLQLPRPRKARRKGIPRRSPST